MKAIKYIYWQEEDMWLGYLEEYPDYWTQGKTLEELEENLRDIYNGMHINPPLGKTRLVSDPVTERLRTIWRDISSEC